MNNLNFFILFNLFSLFYLFLLLNLNIYDTKNKRKLEIK